MMDRTVRVIFFHFFNELFYYYYFFLMIKSHPISIVTKYLFNY